MTEAFKEYFSEYKTEYNRIYRIMWHKMTDPSYRTKYPKDSYFVTEICQEYNMKGNSIFKNEIVRSIVASLLIFLFSTILALFINRVVPALAGKRK